MPTGSLWPLLILASFVLAFVLSGCSEISGGGRTENGPRQILDSALEAHGGRQELQAASTWKSEVRRYQRGGSYVMTNYYRPGMVRLEQVQKDGTRSADVIGHPHCWGQRGLVSVPCSPETRENDRPRVIMEMAAQLWPLAGGDWELLGSAHVEQDGKSYDQISAYYAPLESQAELLFDQGSHLLHSISIPGMKHGVLGIHMHVYSDYRQQCGVLMPAHNVKSFEGDVWVEEDILSIECRPVDESMFVRPAQVVDGHIVESQTNTRSFVCSDLGDSGGSAVEDHLSDLVEANGMSVVGVPQRHIENDGAQKVCVPVAEIDSKGRQQFTIHSLTTERDITIYNLNEDLDMTEIIDRLISEVQTRNLTPIWPVRVVHIDNDGMGLTGEVVIQTTIGVQE